MFYNGVELKEGEYIFPGIQVVDDFIDDPHELIDIANSTPDGWMPSAVGGDDHIDTDARRSNSFHFQIGRAHV